MEKYNLDKLVKAKAFKACKSNYYTFRSEKRLFGIITRKRGFYYRFIGVDYTGTECPKNHFLENGTVYEKPEVRLFYEGDIMKRYYFDNYDLAVKFVSELTKTNNWIS